MKIRVGIFSNGMCHMRPMFNHVEPSFATVIVPRNKGMWSFWKEKGIPIEHLYLMEDPEMRRSPKH